MRRCVGTADVWGMNETYPIDEDTHGQHAVVHVLQGRDGRAVQKH